MPKKTTKRKTSKSKTASKGKSNYNFYVKIDPNLKYLILHESPSEAKKAMWYIESIEKFLWGKTLALATAGHFYVIPKEADSDTFWIDTKKWEPKWKIDNSARRKSTLNNMKKAWETVKKNKWYVIIGSDPDREGEIIAYEIIKFLGLKKWEYKRLRPRDFSENWYILALKELENDINWDMLDSGLARQIFDKWIGFKRTKDFWEVAKDYKTYKNIIRDKITKELSQFQDKYKSLIEKNKSLLNMIKEFESIEWNELDDFNYRLGIGIGRVQIPTLKLLVEKNLDKFSKDISRKVDLLLEDKEDNKWSFIKNKEYEETPEKTEKVYKFLQYALEKKLIIWAKITDIRTKKSKIKPPTPLDTQLAQSSINSTFWYSLKTIMAILQQGYQQWVHTYMRTDSIDVPAEYIDYVKKMIQLNWIKAKFVMRNYKSDSEDTQWWHHAILPTKPFKLSSIPWNWQHQKVWEYIIRRTIASFLEEAEIEYIDYVLTLDIKKSDGKVVQTQFILKDKKIIKKGWLEVMNYNIEDYKTKYNFKIWDKVNIKNFELKEKDIKMPWNYTEGSLVKELKTQGIWRPSTWESIVSTLIDKWYITSKNKKLNIEPKWYWVYQIVKSLAEDKKDVFFQKIFDLKFTQDMEKELELIASGKEDKKKVIERFFKELKIL